jgi:uncharacterized protein YegL
MSNNNTSVTAGNNGLNNTQQAANILQARKMALSPLHYNARVKSDQPCCIVLLLDQSGSMSEEVINNRGEAVQKAETLSHEVNKFLNGILVKCRREDLYKNYFDILIIGYGREEDEDYEGVVLAWEGKLKGKSWVNVNDLIDTYLRKDTIEITNTRPFGPRIIKDEYKCWIEPYAEGLTPMKKAFQFCRPYIQDWVSRNPNSFPPLIFNITDGEVSDVDEMSELIHEANTLKSLSTSNGNALLFNLLISDNHEQIVEFPHEHEIGLFEKTEFEKAMFEASSVIPKNLIPFLPVRRSDDEPIKAITLGNLEHIFSLLNIGTTTLDNLTE